VNVAETLLVFAGAPLAVIGVLAALIFLPAARSKRPRYKPGQPWDHQPVWFEPHPEGGAGGGHGGGHGAAVHGDDTLAIGSSVYGEPTGGSSDSHGSAHGSTSAGAARPSVLAGPLGGARGTW
jgi:hypothetical protein